MPVWGIVVTAVCGPIVLVVAVKWFARRLRRIALPTADMGDAASHLATVLTGSPSLRARLFSNPTKMVGKQLPPSKYWDYGINPYFLVSNPFRFFAARHNYRAQLAKATLEEIAAQIEAGKLSATVNTDAVFEDFFQPIVRVSQLTYNGVFALSMLAFVIGTALIGAGVYIAIYPPSGGNSTVISSIFGSAGAVSALGSIYTMATRGIAVEARRNARMRLVLTGFATELGQLRGYAEAPVTTGATRDLEGVNGVNTAIFDAMDKALGLIPEDPLPSTNGPTGNSS